MHHSVECPHGTAILMSYAWLWLRLLSGGSCQPRNSESAVAKNQISKTTSKIPTILSTSRQRSRCLKLFPLSLGLTWNIHCPIHL